MKAPDQINNGTWTSPSGDHYIKITDKGYGPVEIREYFTKDQTEQTTHMLRQGLSLFKQTLRDAGWKFSMRASPNNV